MQPTGADDERGAFGNAPTWRIDRGALGWMTGVDARRSAAADRARSLARRRRMPPVGAVLRALVHLGPALASWAVLEQGTATSRRSLSRRLRRAFAALGPTYVKLGQIVSAGDGVFPPELVEEFRLLRDRVPAEPFSTVRRTVEEDLGLPIEAVFAEFDEEPIAAASIAQVYRARLHGGVDVVVKVQRSTVASKVSEDVAALAWAAPLLIGRIPVASLANPPALVELFADTVTEELDFRLEAASMLDVAEVLWRAGQTALVVPRPHPDLVTRRVLVMERIEGFPWGDAEGMTAAGIDTAAVLRAALIAFVEGAMLFGVFHGDLHGGNLMVEEDGTVALLDFGITGRLDEGRRLAFLRLMVAATANDVPAQVEALRDLGALPADVDIAGIIDDLGLDRPVRDPTTMSADELAGEIRAISAALLGSGARLPKELMLFGKNLLFLNGAMATMAPDVDILGEVVAITTYFADRHGERIAQELGRTDLPAAVDLDGVRAALGIAEPVESITYRELQARRELIARRMAAHRRDRRRRRPRQRPGGRGTSLP